MFTAGLSLNAAQPSGRLDSKSFREISLDQVAARTSVNGHLVTRGTSRVMTSLRLGSPSTTLEDGSWLYYNYSARIDPNGGKRAGTLVVRFVNSEVSSLTLADEATVVALRAAPRRALPDTLLFAEQKR